MEVHFLPNKQTYNIELLLILTIKLSAIYSQQFIITINYFPYVYIIKEQRIHKKY